MVALFTFSVVARVLSLKKQLTADERRYTLRNQNLETILGLTKKVGLFLYVMLGFLCVHLRILRFKCRL